MPPGSAGLRLDLGESTSYPGRSVSRLIGERIGNTLRLGALALISRRLIGIPLGVIDRHRPPAASRGRPRRHIVLLALPPIVLSLALLFVASRTGWFPVGGLPPGARSTSLRYLRPAGAGAGAAGRRPAGTAAARAIAEALHHPSVRAARARGVPARRVVWRHALRLSLTPVLAVYGVMIGTLISGSFVVEFVMTWPGLGRLLYDGLIARDANVIAGCAATGAAFLAAGVLISDRHEARAAGEQALARHHRGRLRRARPGRRASSAGRALAYSQRVEAMVTGLSIETLLPRTGTGDGYINRFLAVWTPDEQGHALALDRLLVALDIEPFPLPQDEPVPVHNRIAGLLGTHVEPHARDRRARLPLGRRHERAAGVLRLRADVGDPRRARRARSGGLADEAAPSRRVRPPRLLPHRRTRPPRSARPLAARAWPAT